MKNKILTVIKSVLICGSLIGCDCYKSINGLVIDNFSGLPISGSKVSVVGQEKYKTTTDSFGHYNLRILQNGLKCYCKLNKQLLIERESYRSQQITTEIKEIKLTQFHSKWITNESCITTPDTLDGQVIYSNQNIESPAEFKGGESNLFKFISENLKYPSDKMNEEQDRINMTFVIDTLGIIRNPCIEKQFLEGYLTPFEENAIELLKKMPEWKPGKNKGKLVYVRVKIPMRIHLY